MTQSTYPSQSSDSTPLTSAEAPAAVNAGISASLSVRGVSKSFRRAGRDNPTIENINLEIARSEFVAVLGPSGCGKTTLLNLIAGFDRPTRGQILMDQDRIAGPGPERMVMFQEHALFPWLTALGNVMFGLRVRNELSLERRKEIAQSFLDLVGIGSSSSARVHELSGGMKQRVALARALAPRPRVLLMDEPFGALDEMLKEELYQRFQQVLARTGQTVVWVTHNVREAACLADRVVVMRGGPGRVAQTFNSSLPRPRDPYQPQVAEFASVLLHALRDGSPQQETVHETKRNGGGVLSAADRYLADGI